MAALTALLMDLPDMPVPKKIDSFKSDQEMDERFARFLEEESNGALEELPMNPSHQILQKEPGIHETSQLQQDLPPKDKKAVDELSDEDAFVMFMKLSFPEEWQKETITIESSRVAPVQENTFDDAHTFLTQTVREDILDGKEARHTAAEEISVVRLPETSESLVASLPHRETQAFDPLLEKKTTPDHTMPRPEQTPALTPKEIELSKEDLPHKDSLREEKAAFPSEESSVSFEASLTQQEKEDPAPTRVNTPSPLLSQTDAHPEKPSTHILGVTPSLEKGFTDDVSSINPAAFDADTAQAAVGPFLLEPDAPASSPLIQESFLERGVDQKASEPTTFSPLPMTSSQTPSEKVSSPLPQPALSSIQVQDVQMRALTLEITPPTKERAGSLHLKLEPEHLGKVDVRVHLTQDGRLDAVVHVEKNHALDLFRQDSGELQRLIAEAFGHENATMDFNLTGGEQSQRREEGRIEGSHDNKLFAHPEAPLPQHPSYGAPTLDQSRALDQLA
ncbi:MAG: flagellar hook-length control protein FliK [Alphaproteobacteria bacterium]|nr:flagellar hook-length control protein FliK [Alphaproteobacteria bacterium]